MIIAVVLTACCKIVSIDLLGIHRNLHGKLAKRVKFLHLIRQVVHFGVQIVHFGIQFLHFCLNIVHFSLEIVKVEPQTLSVENK